MVKISEAVIKWAHQVELIVKQKGISVPEFRDIAKIPASTWSKYRTGKIDIGLQKAADLKKKAYDLEGKKS